MRSLSENRSGMPIFLSTNDGVGGFNVREWIRAFWVGSLKLGRKVGLTGARNKGIDQGNHIDEK